MLSPSPAAFLADRLAEIGPLGPLGVLPRMMQALLDHETAVRELPDDRQLDVLGLDVTGETFVKLTDGRQLIGAEADSWLDEHAPPVTDTPVLRIAARWWSEHPAFDPAWEDDL